MPILLLLLVAGGAIALASKGGSSPAPTIGAPGGTAGAVPLASQPTHILSNGTIVQQQNMVPIHPSLAGMSPFGGLHMAQPPAPAPAPLPAPLPGAYPIHPGNTNFFG